ncbi:tyrosine-type recombinase/integrase [Caballeronia sp. J97]|uniref:tyrosine-type recombinase/integrase n=1 Tax=Caballeronia sp. J97 TaxID=2805429 RepID=UPI002AB1A905|nr:tyrosine-type recombinase/integrase [Caballeronia sp. J97]
MKIPSTESASGSGPARDRQLFTVLRDVSLVGEPVLDVLSQELEASTTQCHASFVFMAWPNGAPCVEMELYLLHLVQSKLKLDANGGSVRQEAVKLSHLVRFCFKTRLNFWDLWSHHFTRFIQALQEEKLASGQRAREANQIIEISDSCMRFFTWMQAYLLPHRKIVDVRSNRHQIWLSVSKKKDSRGVVHGSRHFGGNPPPSIRREKTPMPNESITTIFDAVKQRSDAALRHPRFIARFSNRSELDEYLDYQRATWDAILTVCMAVGCRPAELTAMRLEANLRLMQCEKKLELDTRKREAGANRQIPVTMTVIIKLGVYVSKYRAALLRRLRAAGKYPNPNDFLFLNEHGNPLTKETLTRGFSRLCKYAAIPTRTCLSMFRHRTITCLVAIHLKEFCSDRLDMAMHALNDSNYSTILAKVAEITGHKNPESLRPYIHLAWEELGAFDTVQAAVKLSSLLLTLTNDLEMDTERIRRLSIDEKSEAVSRILFYVRESAKEMEEAIAAFRNVRADPALDRVAVPA